MNWMEDLCNTYNRNEKLVGIRDDDGKILLPVAHTTQSAQVECWIDEYGMMIQAEIIAKENAETLIPCTIDSAGRGNAPCAHPLFDKLFYIAKNYNDYVSSKSKKTCQYELFKKEISAWCESEFSHPLVQQLFEYLEKGTLIQDLVERNILYLDENGKIMDAWKDKENKPDVFKFATAKPSEVFLRFVIQDEKGIHKLWKDTTVQKSFTNYYLSTLTEIGLDYVSGDVLPIITKNPSKIRNSADMAKLISFNDSRGFTYRGRFTESNQSLSIGYISSQKAHNALRWLIDKQGARYGKGELAVVAWGEQKVRELNPLQNFFDNMKELDCDIKGNIYETYSKKIRNAFLGYGKKKDLESDHFIHLMAVDSATPGRLSIVYYQSFATSNYLKKMELWYTDCSWSYLIGFENDDKGKSKMFHYAGTPSPMDIIKAAYGDHVKDNLVKNSVQKLLYCMIHGTFFPKDIVSNISNRLKKPLALGSDFYRIGNIGCAVIRKALNEIEKKEKWKMELDITNEERDYLYGRYLAYIDEIESLSYYLEDKKQKNKGNKKESSRRTTNAIRYMDQFQKNPLKIVPFLYKQISYYIAKTGDSGHYLDLQLRSIGAQLKKYGKDNKPLDDSFILGFFAQSNEFRLEHERISKENKEREVI